MEPTGSVSHWLGQLKAGDRAAAQPLWERYFRRLVGLARTRLQGTPRRAADEEDVVLSAFDSFCRGAQQGRYPRLGDRDDLWRLLVLLTAHKALDRLRHDRRLKRGGGKTAAADLAAVVGPEPTPEFAAGVAEECRRLLDQLGDEELRSIALWKMEGYTNAEIAGRLGCVERSIERRLKVIRSLWSR